MIFKFLIIIFFSISFLACSSVPRFTNRGNDNGNERFPRSENENQNNYSNAKSLKTFYGTASYYAEKYNGGRTANGEVYDMNDLTAASNDLPFDTIVRVTNLSNKKDVTLRINDRGPFVNNRIIDISKKAAEELDMTSSGTAKVRIDVVKWGK
jgi:rare lipoprotein A (peptidoglycan hydrolase)